MGKIILMVLALLTTPICNALALPFHGTTEMGAFAQGSISFLVAATIGYEVRKAMDARKEKQAMENNN